MRLGAGVCKLIVFAMMVTLVFPFAATTASAQYSVSLGTNSPATLLSDDDVLNYLESTLIRDTSTRRGIARSNNSGLSFVKKSHDKAGQDHYLYQKRINGVPVYGEYARIHLDSNRRVNLIQNGLTSEQNMNMRTTPTITTDEAIHNVIADVELEIGQAIVFDSTIGALKLPETEATLMIYPLNDQHVLTYEIKLHYIKPIMGSWVAYVDAMTGSVIKRYSTINHSHYLNPTQAAIGSGVGTDGNSKVLNMYHDVDGDMSSDQGDFYRYYLIDVTKPMFNNYHDVDYADNVIWTTDWTALSAAEDSFSTTTINDPDAVDAHYNSGLVYDFYEDLGWDGITGQGGSIVSVIHYEEEQGVGFDNAFWADDAVFYGDGSGGLSGFNCLACARDVVAHELTHGVTQYSADLYYEFESGALNESISDIMAAVIDNDDWTIGEDALSGGNVLRNLQDPGASIDPQPAHMNDYQDLGLVDDNGGIHINSGIPNHAAYLMATGLDIFFDDAANADLSTLDGRTILGELTFDVLTNYLTPVSNFGDARDSYIAAAYEYMNRAGIVWTNAQETEFVQIISDAWTAVGIQGLNISNFEVGIDNASGRQTEIITHSSMVKFYVPYGTNVTSIEPTITTSVYSNYSPVGPQDFSETVTYTVYSDDDPFNSQVWYVSAIVEPILQYSTTAFSEASANNGSITNTITATLINDTFTGADGSDLVADDNVWVLNVPTGLTAEVIKTNATTVTISLSGTASDHANNDDLSDIEVIFWDEAFTSFYGYQVTNSIQDLSIDFADPVATTSTSIFFFPVDEPEIIVNEDGLEYIPSEEDTETETDENGNTVVNVTLSEDTVDELVAQLNEDNSQQRLMINIDEDSDIAQLQISASELLKFAASAPNTVIIMKSGSSSYQLPVGLLDLEALAAELNGTIGTLNIQIRMEKITGEVRSSFFKSASGAGAKPLGEAIDFSIIAEANGASKEIKDFGRTYVSRTITIDGYISSADASVVVFNPTTNRLSFVPATFKVIDGKTEVTMKRNGNSIYAVVSTKKIFFDDVQQHWAANDIEFLASRMIISGYNASTFKPNDNITRAQFLTMLVQALGLTTDEEVAFSDIPANAWYRGYVGAAVKAGITSGLGDHKFMPDALITREQMAVMISNALTFLDRGFNDGETAALLEQFVDRDAISAWARTSVAASYDAGIIRGMDPETFAPLEYATRAQAAVMIRGLLASVDFVN